jgi:hypothetical protein
MELRRQWKILLQLQFEGLGTQIGRPNQTFRNSPQHEVPSRSAPEPLMYRLALSEMGGFETSPEPDLGVRCARQTLLDKSSALIIGSCQGPNGCLDACLEYT